MIHSISKTRSTQVVRLLILLKFATILLKYREYLLVEEAHFEPSRTSKMGLFAKIVNYLTIVAKSSILDDRLGSEYTSESSSNFGNLNYFFQFVCFPVN